MDNDVTEYKREFYRLRYEFFKRDKEPDGECLSPELCKQAGAIPCDNCHEWGAWDAMNANYKYLAENPDNDTNAPPDDPNNCRQFMLEVNINATITQIDEEIKRQVAVIRQQIRESRTKYIVRGPHHKNRSGQKDTLNYWRKCLDAYDMSKAGVSWQEIGQKYDNGYKAGSAIGQKGGIKPKGSYTAEARKFYKEAERLIQSATNGNFPD